MLIRFQNIRIANIDKEKARQPHHYSGKICTENYLFIQNNLIGKEIKTSIVYKEPNILKNSDQPGLNLHGQLPDPCSSLQSRRLRSVYSLVAHLCSTNQEAIAVAAPSH